MQLITHALLHMLRFIWLLSYTHLMRHQELGIVDRLSCRTSNIPLKRNNCAVVKVVKQVGKALQATLQS